MEDLKRLQNRVDWFCENKVNAFSPTISPAPKSIERREIESIEKGVKFYYNAGVKEIVVQKKYMGSYCDIYLKRDLEDTYFVSRNGFKIEHIDLKAAKEACHKLHQKFDWNKLAMVIIQSEMMPWRVLGKGLIDNEFITYLNVHKNHHNYLCSSNLYQKIEQVKQSTKYKDYIKDKQSITSTALKEKYPLHIIRQYDSLTNFRVLDLSAYKQSVETYEKQICHFGEKAKIYFKPFNILKKVYNDGVEELVNDNLSYCEINDDEYLHVPIANEEQLDNSIKKIYQWFEKLESHLEEGIVIKPRVAFCKRIPPALKVRNDDYLTMVYGMDFQEEYDRFIEKRNVRKKIECSINDWMLNWEILSIPYQSINKENYLLKNLVLDRILGEEAEASLDKRL